MFVLALLAGAMVWAGRTGPATNSLGMKLVRVAPGNFLMGSVSGGDWDERPVHWVTIRRPFLISATEVTNAQYEQFDPEHRKWRGQNGFSRGDDEAAIFVSWHEAARFCEWLSRKEGKPYRLPTEAEWEYACRAGTTTPFSTGRALPLTFYRNQRLDTRITPVPLLVGLTLPNPWGLFDMHGNVEEWCLDWYGPYRPEEQFDPVGYADGDFRVTRGGSHGTEIAHLRSANRMGTLPEDRSWGIGFRVVQAELPPTQPLPRPAEPRWAQGVSQERCDWSGGPDGAPYFEGPIPYVKIPKGSNGPLFASHNHQPAITACPNGDLLAIWYTTRREQGRELAVAASRLRRGARAWEPAAPFWDAPDRNDHGSALCWDGANTLYHFNGLGTDAGWEKLALLMRTSTDNGATWSKARFISPDHGVQHQAIRAFCTRDGRLILACDASPGGNGGTVLHISHDGGGTWSQPAAGQPKPRFGARATGAWIAGIHAGVAELRDGSLLAVGRGDSIRFRMPMSRSRDGGQTWSYAPSPFPPLIGGQRPILLQLRGGPLLLISFTDAQGMDFRCDGGAVLHGRGMFAALSYDNGRSWPVRKLVTAGGLPRRLNGGGNTGTFVMDATHAEPAGYLAATETPDGVIHLLSSALHYRFNLAWLQAPMRAPARIEPAADERTG